MHIKANSGRSTPRSGLIILLIISKVLSMAIMGPVGANNLHSKDLKLKAMKIIHGLFNAISLFDFY